MRELFLFLRKQKIQINEYIINLTAQDIHELMADIPQTATKQDIKAIIMIKLLETNKVYKSEKYTDNRINRG